MPKSSSDPAAFCRHNAMVGQQQPKPSAALLRIQQASCCSLPHSTHDVVKLDHNPRGWPATARDDDVAAVPPLPWAQVVLEPGLLAGGVGLLPAVVQVDLGVKGWGRGASGVVRGREGGEWEKDASLIREIYLVQQSIKLTPCA
jgi:hypothetical protein